MALGTYITSCALLLLAAMRLAHCQGTTYPQTPSETYYSIHLVDNSTAGQRECCILPPVCPWELTSAAKVTQSPFCLTTIRKTAFPIANCDDTDRNQMFILNDLGDFGNSGSQVPIMSFKLTHRMTGQK
jgi:hypothetical protein